jgi:hypothetical protein
VTLEEYLKQQGNQWRDRIDYGEDGGVAGAGWGRYVENDGGISWQYVDDETLGYLQSNPSIYNPAPQTAQPTIEQPVVAQPQAPQPVALPTPKSLEEYLQQQGFNEYKPLVMGTGADYTEEIKQKAGYGKTIKDATEDYPAGYFQYAPAEVIDAYYNNPKNFVQTRETPVGQGINTFNEGNPDQKRIIDQINTGQLMIVPSTAPDVMGRQSNEYNVVDSRTGQVVQPNITAIDASKGIFNIVADDRNSSGYFNNYVSTDPKGFVNPIVSEQQSQYASRANNSLNFIKDSIKGLLTMGGLGATALGAGAALGSATGLGTVGGNIALNTGLGALKQGIDGQFNPLGLATSAALSYGLGGAGAEGADPLTADDMYTGQAMTNLASSDDATRLADLVRAFENPSELTGPTIDVASRPSVSLENSVIDTDVPLMPSNMEGDITYRSPLTDFSPNVDIQDLPQELDITGSLANPYTSPTFPVLDISPEYDPSAYVPNIPTNLGEITPYIPTDLSGLDFQPSVVGSNLGGFDNIPTIGGTDLGGFDNIPSNLGTNLGGGIPTDLGGLDVPFDTTAPTDLKAGELTVTGERPYVPFEENFPLPYEPFEADFPLPYEPFEEDFPLQPDETAPLTTPKILSNILKSTPSALPKAIATQQQSNLANILRSSQMPQSLLPAIYKQANPFNFGQQASPVQDTNALVKLLRTA